MARVAKWIGIVLACLVLLVGFLLLFINTTPGRSIIAGQLGKYETASGLSIHVDRIEGSIYSRMEIKGLAVHDTKGVFLTSPALTLDWRPFAYMHGLVDLREVTAGEIRVMRAPVMNEVPSDPNAPLLPDIDVALGKFRIGRLIVEPPVTGRRHIVRLAGSADIADGRARVSADAAAVRAAGLAGGDTARVRLDAVPDEDKFDIEARVAAPAGGMVDSYAGLGKPIDIAVTGRGGWSSWNGRADARLAGQPVMGLGITGRSGVFAVRGDVRPGLMLTGPAARLTEPRIAIALDATLGDRLADIRLNARSAAMAMAAQGRLDLGESRFGGVRVATRLLQPGAIAENVRARDAQVALLLDGPFTTPSIAYRVTATSLGFGETGIEGLVAQGRATIDTDRIAVPINATARRVTGLNAAAGGLLTNLRINGDLIYANGRAASENLRLRSDKIDATAIVIADIGKGTYTGALKGRVNDYQVDGIGRIGVVADAELVTGPKGGFGIKGWVRATTARFDNASVRDFLGGNATLTANVGFDEDGVASVSNLRVMAPQFRVVDGQGSYRPDGSIAFRGNAVSSQYGPVSVAVGGTIAQPHARLVAARPGMGVDLRDVVAELTGTAQGYAIKGRGNSAYGPFTADLLVRAGEGPLSIGIRQARFAGVDFRGTITQTAAGPFAGRIALAGSGLNGGIRLAAQGTVQRADIDVTANAAQIPGDMPIVIGSGLIRGTAILYPDAPAITGTALLQHVASESFALDKAQGRIDYRGGRGNVAFTATGQSGVPFDIAGQASLSPDRIVANVKGEASDIAFRLAAPAIVTRTPAGWDLAETVVVLPKGQARLAGTFGNATRVRARLEDVDLALARAISPAMALGGKVTGGIDYSAEGNAIPTVEARLDIARLTRTAAYVVSRPVDVAVQGRLNGSGGTLGALIKRNGASVGRLQARLAPIPGGAEPWSERLLSAPLGGGIRYNGPAEVLWTLTGIAGQELSGPIAVAADFGGRLDRPSMTGVIRANALRYENTAYGTVLSNIALDGRFTQSTLQIASLTARAGSGSITARGNVGIDAASGFPIEIDATLDRAQLAKSDALGATVSGTIAVRNNKADGASITGDIRIPEARYQIVMQGAAEVPELTGVRRKNVPVRTVPLGQESSVPSNWKLDIRVHADNRVYVSGMGLEAEWAMDLRVRGTASDPRIVGTLEVVRGTYSFAGRRFDLDESGEVTFDGGPATNPTLSLAATTTVEGVTAIINIGGRAMAPQISFTSTPALPQDEVLSRLLFGSSVTNLTPMQAIQLAAALNSLRGGGGGLNPLGKLRSASGIDRLRVLGADKSTGRGTSVAVGQHISNDIYVEVITDARGFTATQLEIALSKALSVLSQTSSFGGSSVNLRYSKDY